MKPLKSIAVVALLISVIVSLIAFNGLPADVNNSVTQTADISSAVTTPDDTYPAPVPPDSEPPFTGIVTAVPSASAEETEISAPDISTEGTADEPTSPLTGPETTEVQTTEVQTTEVQTTEVQTTEVQTTEVQTTEVQTTEVQTTEARTTEAQTTEARTTEARTTAPITEKQITSAVTTAPPAPEAVKIGISYCTSSSITRNCISSVNAVGGTPVTLPLIRTEAEAKKALESVDALIMTGGEDIDPSYYGEEPLPEASLDINPARDKSDFLLLQAALDADMPVLCICRGMQLLNVMNGGTLYQDIPSQLGISGHRDPATTRFLYHNITVTKNTVIRSIIQKSSLKVNSWHHQSVKDIGKGLSVTAESADGIVEAIELQGKRFVIGVQFHPEKETSQPFRAFFSRLADEGKAFRDAEK